MHHLIGHWQVIGTSEALVILILKTYKCELVLSLFQNKWHEGEDKVTIWINNMQL